MAFRNISMDEFDALLASAPASPSFREQFARYDFSRFGRDVDAAVQQGHLEVPGSLVLPAFYTLVIGDLDVKGVIDMHSENWEFGGRFIVLGDVRCSHFISDEAAAVLIDGDLNVEGAIVNAFSDSLFDVMGSLHARLHIGHDMHIGVGGGARVDYGIGYCTPLGDIRSAILPRHGEEETVAALAIASDPELEWRIDVNDVADVIRNGRRLWK